MILGTVSVTGSTLVDNFGTFEWLKPEILQVLLAQ